MKDEKEVFRGLDDVVRVLNDAGEQARADDLSVEMQRNTRRSVAEMLDSNQVEASCWSWGRVIAATAVPVAACLVAVLLFVNHDTEENNKSLDLVAAAEVEAGIMKARENLGIGMSRLQGKVSEEVRESYVDARAGRLKKRVEVCSMTIRRELYGEKKSDIKAEL